MMQCSNRAARMVLGSLMSLTLTLAVCGEDSEERTLTKSFTVEPGGLVSVTASQGDIEMVTGKQNAVEIVVEREVKGANESEAASLRKKNKVSFSQEGNNIYVESGEKGSKAKLDKLEIHIRV